MHPLSAFDYAAAAASETYAALLGIFVAGFPILIVLYFMARRAGAFDD